MRLGAGPTKPLASIGGRYVTVPRAEPPFHNLSFCERPFSGWSGRMSALTQNSDIDQTLADVREVPLADKVRSSKATLFDHRVGGAKLGNPRYR